ncbi:MAG TPA: macrolide family glycosyltransferase [Candidatus Saccharimonadales bacterium]|nr:macrolide family glycosyltransferase [Candidatus Saccharimonadales bacterium]
MKKIIFYSMPAQGHTIPTIPLAKELVKRGNKVFYYSIEEFKTKIEEAGLIYKSYDRSDYFDPILSKDVSFFAKKVMETTSRQSPILTKKAELENADCIVHDTLAFWGKVVGKSLQIPTVSVFTSLAYNNTIARRYPMIYLPEIMKALLGGSNTLKAYTEYRKICWKYKIPADLSASYILTREKLNLVLTSSYFQPCADSFNNSFRFVGPPIYQREQDKLLLQKLDKKKKIIYVSMGTIFNDNLSFFQQCIDLFENTDYQIIMSLGHRLSEKHLAKIPPNIIVRNYVPQLEILQNVDLFITHAGLNSINESLFYGVPMILIPQMYEQAFNAFRVQELGAGIFLKHNHITSEKILKSIDKIFSTPSYYKNAQKIKKTLEQAGGYNKAADEILAYINK